MKSKRQVIRAKDIQGFFGKGKSMSHKIMNQIREYYKVPKLPNGRNGLITISMFCEYYNIPEKDLIKSIKTSEELESTTRSG
jgi:hypothetical protein